VNLDSVIDKKVDALDSHVSQFYEWLPWVDGKLADVPSGAAERKAWLKNATQPSDEPQVRASLVKWYGAEKGNAAKFYERSRSANMASSQMKRASANYFRC